MPNIRVSKLHLAIFLLFACVFELCGQTVPREDDPDSPSPLDAVIQEAMVGNLSVFHSQTTTEQFKTIRRLKDRIAIQHEPDNAYALTMGEVLVELHAEEPLRDLVINLSKEGYGIDREISVTFHALSFMKSKAAVRVLASFLDDPNELIIQKQRESLGKMDEAEQKAYLATQPRLSIIWRSCYFTGNVFEAEYALARLNLPNTPKWDGNNGFAEGHLQHWRDWWQTNKKKFEGDGPISTW